MAHVGKICSRVAAVVAMTAVLTLAPQGPAQADRIKDLVSIRGVSSNALVGYGLVVGLAGTGDNLQSVQTQQMMANMLSRRFGTIITPSDIKAQNVAVVMVTARLPPFARVGQRVDVTASSTSNAKSLFGGTLLPTALKGGNGKIYAWGEGSLSVGGFAAGGASGSSVTRNHPTVGRVPSGAVVGKELGFRLSADKPIVVALKRPDFTTAARIVQAVNDGFGARIASAPDSGTIRVVVPKHRKHDLVGMIAQLENIEVTPDTAARVIINERTGTIVMGGDVRLRACAISHGGLTVEVTESSEVSQPKALSKGGKAVTVPRTEIEVTEDGGDIRVITPGPSLADVVSGLNALGVRPRDLVAILLALKESGALRAEIEIQ